MTGDHRDHLLIPLPLAELMYVTLGTYIASMDENDPWRPTLMLVVGAYVTGRDDAVEDLYGPEVARELPALSAMVAETVATWLEREAGSSDDFEEWKRELDEHFFGNGETP